MKLIKLHTHVLPNGLRVYYAQTEQSVVFDLAVHINTGSRDENPKINGVSHFLEHMMFRGSERYSDSVTLGQVLESFGGESNAMTSAENTVYWLRGSVDKFDGALDVFSHFFLKPNFAELDLERSVILQELASEYNEEDLLIDTESLAMGAMFEDHPLGLPIIGTEKAVSKIGLKHLEEKRALTYIPQESILAICASVPFEKAMRNVEPYFGKKWEHAKADKLSRLLIEEGSFFDQSRAQKDVYVCQENSDNQFSAKIIFPAFGGLNRNVVVQNFLQRLLDDGMASRLPATMRERYGLVYDINTDASNYVDVGTFSVEFTVSSEKLEEVLAKLALEFRRLLTTSPEDAEVEHIRFRYRFELENVRESPQRLLNREVANAFLSRSLSLDEELDAVNSVTSTEIREMAQRIFTARRRAFVLVGPRAASKKAKLETLFKGLK